MIRARLAVLVAWAVLLGVASAQGIFVRASRRAVVRDQPSLAATELERLDKGDERACVLDSAGNALQQHGFYKIQTSPSELGWVSRFTVRLNEGVPETQEASESAPATEEAGSMTSRHTAAELEAFRKKHMGRFGFPVGQITLVGEGFVIGYDPRLKIPVWVQYRLTKDDIGERERKESFREDPRLGELQRSKESDYDQATVKSLWTTLGMTRDGSETPNFYAKGHLVPDGSQGRTAALQRDTYVMSNMTPQVQNGFNGGTWLLLEKAIRKWCEEREALTIIAGPIFDPAPRVVAPEKTGPERRAALADPSKPAVKAQPPTERQVVYNVLGSHDVAVPSAFFCVVLDDSDPEDIQVLGFIIDNASVTVDQGRDLESCLRSVKEIQGRTGLDLIGGVADDVEAAIEAEVADDVWE